MTFLPARYAVVLAAMLAFACAGILSVNAQESEQQAQAESASESGTGQIEKRLRRIEDSIIDMRAMIGALQSFAPEDASSAAASSSAPDESDSPADPLADVPREAMPSPGTTQSGAPSAEIESLEIQVQALAAQLSETVKRLGRLEEAVGLTPGAQPETGEPSSPDTALAGEADTDSGQEADTESGAAPPGFGTMTVETPEDTGESDAPDMASEERFSAEADGAASSEAQALYTKAYDALKTQDYERAREGFELFINEYPDDPLANDARYWMADAAFAMGDYVFAANNLVKVYNAAPSGEKSEETLLKLAIALRRLDRPESACEALSRLEGRADGMPQDFLARVESERARSGC